MLPAVITATMLLPVPVAAFTFLGTWDAHVVTTPNSSSVFPFPPPQPGIGVTDNGSNGGTLVVDMGNFSNNPALTPAMSLIQLNRQARIDNPSEIVTVDRLFGMTMLNAGFTVKVMITPPEGPPVPYNGTFTTYPPASGIDTPISNTGNYTMFFQKQTTFKSHDFGTYSFSGEQGQIVNVSVTVRVQTGSGLGLWLTTTPFTFTFSSM
jgi:hypothetical protein